MDIDTPNRLRLLMVYFNLRYMFSDVIARDSASRKGYHVIAYGGPHDREKNLEIRRALGDDPRRIRIDERTIRHEVKKPFQILFTWKNGSDAEDVDPLALPFKVMREVRKCQRKKTKRNGYLSRS